jgi:hypothetical protein
MPKQALAAVFECSRRTIGRIQINTCFAYLWTQGVLLSWVLTQLRAKPPTFGACSTLWDETGQRVQLRMLKMANASTQSSKWEIFVCKKSFMWGWITPTGGCLIIHFHVVVPPLPLLNTGAKDLHNALHYHPQIKQVAEFEAEFVKLCEHAFDLKEADGAPGNDRYVAHRSNMLEEENDPALRGFLTCLNHGNQLIESQALGVAGHIGGQASPLLSDWYSMSLFCRTGGHFVRIIAAVSPIAKKIHIVEGNPPIHAKEVAEQLVDLMVQHHDGQARSQDRSAAASNKFRQKAKRNFEILNGRVADRLCHFSVASVDKDMLAVELMGLIYTLVLPSLPATPSMNKWTKLEMCLMFFFIACMFNLMQLLAELAFDKLDMRLLAAAAKASDSTASDPQAAVDEQYHSDNNWHAVTGKRLKVFMTNVQGKLNQQIRAILIVLFEPLWYLTRTFMGYSNAIPNYERYPPLMNLIYGPTSPLVWVKQYYSEVLRCSAPRLRIILAACGCDSFAEWELKFPHMVAYVRRLVLMIQAMVEHRHVGKICVLPWTVFAFGDPRVPLRKRRADCSKFMSTNDCCIPHGMARDMATEAKYTVALLLGPVWGRIFFSPLG